MEDNNTTYKPSVGELIEENCAVGAFSDNFLYLITSSETDFAKQAVDIMEQYKLLMNCDDYYHTYELEVVPSVELNNHPKLRERIELHGDNLLLQLPAFAGGHNTGYKKRFIVAKADSSNIFELIHQMVYEAEHIAKGDMDALLRSFIEEDTDEFVELTRKYLAHRGFGYGFFDTPFGDAPVQTYNMRAPTAKQKEQMEIEGPITHKQLMEMYDRLPDNLKKSHKKHDPKMEAEIEYIIRHMNPATLRMFLQSQSPKFQEKLANFVNPKHLAEVSSMDLEIRWFEKIDKIRKTDGHYRLFLCRNDERLMVRFSRSAGFVLYLIYLIDRKKNGDNVDTLNIVQYKQLFGKLYEMTYDKNGEALFTDMVKNFNAQGESKQKGLYYVLKSIRKDVGNTCERMQEAAEPFLLQNAKAHLSVLPKHIILPKEIIALF